MNNTQKNLAMKVSVQSIIVNVFLTIFKLFAGVFAHSSAMISDAIHSASDVFSTFVVMIGVTLSGKTEDKEHPYGHERIECVAAISLAMILLATGLGIGYDGLQKIMRGMDGDLAAPGMLALVAAVTSIAVKEWMYWFTRAAAKKVNSGALMADAWHHRSDALSSVGSLIGIAGARMGYPILDPVACIVICFFIVKAAYDIFFDAINKMTDCSCDEAVIEKMREIARQQEGVQSLDMIKTRLFGSRIYVDIEIGADGSLTLNEAHDIALGVHNKIEEAFEDVKHCMVHVNPVEEKNSTEEKIEVDKD